MSAKLETSIWMALRSRIETIPLDYAVAWPGETFTAPYEASSTQPYLRVGRVTASPVRLFVQNDQSHDRTGSIIITLVNPIRPDMAVSVYDQRAATIAEHFRDGTEMLFNDVLVTVTSYPHVQNGYEDNGYWTVPVRIPWRCLSNKPVV